MNAWPPASVISSTRDDVPGHRTAVDPDGRATGLRRTAEARVFGFDEMEFVRRL